MSTSHSVAQAIMNAVADLDEAFEDLPQASTVVPFRPLRAARPTPATLTECVPLLALALQFVDRAPCALTVNAVERYRADATRMLENMRPVIERAAGLTLEDWAAQTFADADVADVVEELADGFELTEGQFPESRADDDMAVSMPECIPLLAVALEIINRGPAGLTIEAVEHYRESIMNLLERIRPAIEHEARHALAAWTSQLQAA